MTNNLSKTQEFHKKAIDLKTERDAINVLEDPAKWEILDALYSKAWRDFEDRVWIECGLPRHELLLKRKNFG